MSNHNILKKLPNGVEYSFEVDHIVELPPEADPDEVLRDIYEAVLSVIMSYGALTGGTMSMAKILAHGPEGEPDG